MAACGSDSGLGPITHLPRDLTAGEQQLVAANNRFAFAFFGAAFFGSPLGRHGGFHRKSFGSFGVPRTSAGFLL